MPVLSTLHPFFLPLWRRILVVAAIFGWTLFEISMGAWPWAAFFAGLGAYCAWSFFKGDYAARVEAHRKS